MARIPTSLLVAALCLALRAIFCRFRAAFLAAACMKEARGKADINSAAFGCYDKEGTLLGSIDKISRLVIHL